jgi:Ran GTPase-activating protein (RanGAP) involved in mRNA processing and transport
MTEEKNIITINDKEYNIADLNQNQQYFIAQIKDLEAKGNNLKFQLDQVTVAKDSFTQALIKSVEEVKDETENGTDT